MKSRFLSSSRLYDFNALSGRRRRTNQNARTVAPPTATPLRSIGVVFLFFSFVFVVLILLSFWLLPSPHLPSVAWPTDALLISSFSIGSFGSRRGQIGRAPIGNNSNNSNNNNNNNNKNLGKTRSASRLVAAPTTTDDVLPKLGKTR